MRSLILATVLALGLGGVANAQHRGVRSGIHTSPHFQSQRFFNQRLGFGYGGLGLGGYGLGINALGFNGGYAAPLTLGLDGGCGGVGALGYAQPLVGGCGGAAFVSPIRRQAVIAGGCGNAGAIRGFGY